MVKWLLVIWLNIFLINSNGLVFCWEFFIFVGLVIKRLLFILFFLWWIYRNNWLKFFRWVINMLWWKLVFMFWFRVGFCNVVLFVLCLLILFRIIWIFMVLWKIILLLRFCCLRSYIFKVGWWLIKMIFMVKG